MFDSADEYEIKVQKKNTRIEFLEEQVAALQDKNWEDQDRNRALHLLLDDARSELRTLKDKVEELKDKIEELDPLEPPSPPHHPDPVFDDSYRPALDHTIDPDANSDSD
jgi:polyhydroxyalkanoate synthesis regulator phasin